MREKADQLAAEADPSEAGKARRAGLPSAQDLSDLAAEIWKRQLAMLAAGAPGGGGRGGDEGMDIEDEDDDDDMEAALANSMETSNRRDKTYDQHEYERMQEEMRDKREAGASGRFGSGGGGGGGAPAAAGGSGREGEGATELRTREVLREIRWEKDKASGGYKRVVLEHREADKIKEYVAAPPRGLATISRAAP